MAVEKIRHEFGLKMSDGESEGLMKTIIQTLGKILYFIYDVLVDAIKELKKM